MRTAAHSTRLDLAAAFAIDAFRDKVRKTTSIPYVTHLFAVAALVGEHGGDEDQICAALLHDVLEDVDGVTAGDLELRFGSRVARLVVALSDTVTRPKAPWKERKTRYLAQLRAEPAEIKLVSAADKLHNAISIRRDWRRIGDTVYERFSVPKSDTLWYFREVTEALGDGWSHLLLDELRDEVAWLDGH